jgi:hypothetical protein
VNDAPDAGAPAPEVRWYGNLKSVFGGDWSSATTRNDAVPGTQKAKARWWASTRPRTKAFSR